MSLVLRLPTLIKIAVRRWRTVTQETLAGFYHEQASRVTDRPMATRLLQAFAPAKAIRTRLEPGGGIPWHTSPLRELLERILHCLDLPTST